MMNNVIDYFNIAQVNDGVKAQSKSVAGPAAADGGAAPDVVTPAADATSSVGKQISANVQYFVVVVGIVIEPFLRQFGIDRTCLSFGDYPVAQLLLSLFLALLIFPAVYRKQFNEGSPFISQVGTILVGGVGWQSVFTAAIGSSS